MPSAVMTVKVVIAFEGMDAAGKGAIKRIVKKLDPREYMKFIPLPHLKSMSYAVLTSGAFGVSCSRMTSLFLIGRGMDAF